MFYFAFIGWLLQVFILWLVVYFGTRDRGLEWYRVMIWLAVAHLSGFVVTLALGNRPGLDNTTALFVYPVIHLIVELSILFWFIARNYGRDKAISIMLIYLLVRAATTLPLLWARWEDIHATPAP